ncbi:MAG: twin-arginine translocase subunit TatC [Rikenellaceae bacterium]|jgi:sec-independent protein translocase protein TatC|nr:twin-arginine translocase subunit TatC [Rikenellaceae bacterium]
MAQKKGSADDRAEMSFFEHVDALRPHLVRGALALLVISVVAFFLKNLLIDDLLFGPARPEFPTNRLISKIGQWMGDASYQAGHNQFQLISTKLAGQFNLTLNASLVAGLIVTIPYLLWELWRFIKPGLTANERQHTRSFVFYVSGCFFVGVSFGYFIIAPLALQFFTTWQASATITNLIDIGSYLRSVLSTSLGCGLIFQLPVLVYFLSRMGIVTASFLRKYRRHAIVLLAITSAIITPPDLMSMFLVILPLIGLYELSIRIAARVDRKRQQETDF